MADAAAGAVTPEVSAGPPTIRVLPGSVQAYARGCLEAAMAHPKEHLVRRHVRLARLDVIGWFSSGQLAGLFERALVERRQDDPSAGRVEIYAMDAEADGWEPPVRWDEAIWFSSRTFERVLAARNVRGFYHHDAPSWQFYDRATAVGVQTLPTPLAMPPWESSAPLRSFLHWAYAAAGLRLTHAATLGLNGRGVLLAGPSGSGKSATTLAGLLNGLDSVGDDYVLLETGARVSAYPVFTVLKQDREGLRRTGIPLADLGTAGSTGEARSSSTRRRSRGRRSPIGWRSPRCCCPRSPGPGGPAWRGSPPARRR